MRKARAEGIATLLLMAIVVGAVVGWLTVQRR